MVSQGQSSDGTHSEQIRRNFRHSQKTGKFSFTITVKNKSGSFSKKYTVNVIEPVSITTASLKAGTTGKSYSITLKAKGTKPTWSARGLPAGLTINAKTGKISGKPTVYGKFTVAVIAYNEAGIVTRSLSLEIKAVAPKLSGSLKKPTLNVAYSSGLKVTGTTPITRSIFGNLPEGLSFDTATGKISGTPTSYAKSGYKITITAENGGGKASKTITLKVNGKAPVIKGTMPKSAVYGEVPNVTGITGDSKQTEKHSTGIPESYIVVAELGEISCDEAGNEITAVPESRKIILSVWLNKGVNYSPAIAVKK